MGFQAAPLGDKRRYFDVNDEMCDVILRLSLEQPAAAAGRKRTREEAGPSTSGSTRDVFLHAFIVRDSPFFDAIWTRWRKPGRSMEEEEHGMPLRKKGRGSKARPPADGGPCDRTEATLHGADEQVAGTAGGCRLGRCIVHATVTQPEDMDAMHHLMRHWCVLPAQSHVRPPPAAPTPCSAHPLQARNHCHWNRYTFPSIALICLPTNMISSPLAAVLLPPLHPA